MRNLKKKKYYIFIDFPIKLTFKKVTIIESYITLIYEYGKWMKGAQVYIRQAFEKRWNYT